MLRAAEEIVRRTVNTSFPLGNEILRMDLIQARGEPSQYRCVHHIEVQLNGGTIMSLYAKTGNEFQIKREVALYRDVFDPETTKTPRLYGISESGDESGLECLVIEAISGERFNKTNKDHIDLVFQAYAELHRNCRRRVSEMRRVFTGKKGSDNPDPQQMFDELRSHVRILTEIGIDVNVLDVFYRDDVHQDVIAELPTFVHGDISEDNILVVPETGEVRFIDFGYSAIRAGTSEFMYYHREANPFAELFERGLRAYWRAADTSVSFPEFLVRQNYWNASYHADCLTWDIVEWQSSDARNQPEGVANFVATWSQIERAARDIQRLIHEKR